MGFLEEVEKRVREDAKAKAEAELANIEKDLTRKAFPWNFMGGDKALSKSFRDGLIKAKEDAAIERLTQGLVEMAGEWVSISSMCEWHSTPKELRTIGGYQPVRSILSSNRNPIPPGAE